MAIVMSVRSVLLRKKLSKRARICVSPQAIEIPRIWNSGLCRGSPTAKASSMSLPMSVSMMIFSVAFERGTDMSVWQSPEGLITQKITSTVVLALTLAPGDRLRAAETTSQSATLHYRNFIDTAIVTLLDYFRSEVRLAPARLPKKSQI